MEGMSRREMRKEREASERAMNRVETYELPSRSLADLGLGQGSLLHAGVPMDALVSIERGMTKWLLVARWTGPA